jgi:hypothetical protein
MSRPCSTPPSEPVAWRCYALTYTPSCYLVSEPVYVASRTWFDARAFAASHFSTSPSEIWCELFPLEEARNELLALFWCRFGDLPLPEAA